jgi:ABC-2 type transport system ATP-binding protein
VPVREPPPSMQSIVFDSVHKIFRRGGFFFSRRRSAETYALRGLSLEIPCGEILVILGPNGSGKSTTLKLISTMLLPDRGRVLVNGVDTRKEAQQVRRQVGLALAAERSFFPRLTARENLDFFAALEDVPRRERAARVNSVLADVDLADAASKQVMKLSSGMYQRLGIARALIKNPSVLVLDEPTRSLDPSAAMSFWELLRDLRNSGITVVLATHSFAEAVALADRIVVLKAGELLDLRDASGLTVESLRDYYLSITGDFAQSWMEEVPA